MSAWTEARVAPVAVRVAREERRLAPLWVRLLIFFAGTTMAALAYVHLLHEAPAEVAVAVAAVATACGGVLSLGLGAVGRARFSRTDPRRARIARVAVVLVVTVLALELGLLAVGVPVHLIAPWHWGALGRAVDGGLGQLGAWVWPYTGGSEWARLSVLMLLVPTTTLMSLLFFWPAREGAGGRRFGALAIAVALALCGMSNTHGGGWREQGLLLAVLVFAWLWLPTLRSSELGRALSWTVACAVVALIAAPLLGASHGWISFETALEGGLESAHRGQPVAAANDFTGTQAMLYGPIEKSRSLESLLTVQASEPPGLLRVISLDRFDGLRFIRSDTPPETSATDIGAGAEAGWHETATVTVGGLRSNLLAGISGITTRVGFTSSTDRPPALHRAPDGTLSVASPPPVGASYTVLSYTPKPTSAQLRATPSSFPGSYVPYTELELPLPSASALAAPQLAREAASAPLSAQLVRAPALGSGEEAAAGQSPAGGGSAVAARILASPYGPMYRLARHLAAGAGSSYEVVARIERYLSVGYTYDEQPPLVRYPLEAFLFESKRGYCEQFSGAMALMLRMDGIPARVGVGFKPTLTGTAKKTAGGSSAGLVWTALPQDAHAWVEVFFSGIGWVPFDPTPASASAGGGAGSAAFGRLAQEALSPNAGSHARITRVKVPVTRARSGHHGGGSSSPAGWQWALFALVLVSALGGLMYVRVARGRIRERTVPGGGAGAEAAVRELERALRGSAWPLLPGMTLTQVAERLERVAQPQAAAYVRRLQDRRFGRAPALTAAEVSDARSERHALRHALARGRGLRGRLRALRLLPPGAPSL